MSNTIAGVSSLVPPVAQQAAGQQNAAPAAKSPAPAQRKADTVQLSMAAKIRLMRQNGVSSSQIAQRLGVDVKTVSSSLGVAPTKQASASAPQATWPTAPAPQGKLA